MLFVMLPVQLEEKWYGYLWWALFADKTCEALGEWGRLASVPFYLPQMYMILRGYHCLNALQATRHHGSWSPPWFGAGRHSLSCFRQPGLLCPRRNNIRHRRCVSNVGIGFPPVLPIYMFLPRLPLKWSWLFVYFIACSTQCFQSYWIFSVFPNSDAYNN